MRDFEKQARFDGMAVPTLAAKKKALVQELNGFIAQKKAFSEQAEGRAAVATSSKSGTAAARGKDGKLVPLSTTRETHSLCVIAIGDLGITP